MSTKNLQIKCWNRRCVLRYCCAWWRYKDNRHSVDVSNSIDSIGSSESVGDLINSISNFCFPLIGANLPNPQAISFNQCRSPQQFCQVERNMRVLSRVQFAPAQRVNRLQAHAELCRSGGCIEWPLGARSNACNFLLNDAQCPLNAQTSYTFELRGRFPTAVPLNTPIHVYLRVRDADRGTVLSCFRTLVTVTR